MSHSSHVARTPQFPELRPGDLLLYGGGSLAAWLIQFRTWSDVSHVEIYLGGGRSLASRAAGVDIYPLRVLNLRRVLRPKHVHSRSLVGADLPVRPSQNEMEGEDLPVFPSRNLPPTTRLPLNFEQGLQWFRTVQGTRYGYLDLLKFYLIDLPTRGMICSEFADRFFQASGLPLFNPKYPSGAVCPRDYETLSPILADQIWNWK